MKRLFMVLALCVSAAGLWGCAGVAPPPSGFSEHAVERPGGPPIRYMQYVPPGIRAPAPLLVFLHGSGEAGHDLSVVTAHGPWDYVRSHADSPFVVVAPQLDVDQEWPPELVKAVIDKALATLPLDHDRVYVTGLSRGGGGTWDFAMKYPCMVAAIAPVSGYSNLKQPRVLKGVGIWAFHGAKDDVVPPADEQALIAAARAAGIDVNYTLYPEGNHNAWDAAYSDPTLYLWLLTHRRSSSHGGSCDRSATDSPFHS